MCGPDTKILLAVDELISARDKCTSTDTPKSCLGALTQILDNNSELFLAVSAYGCVNLQEFVTASSRELLLQPLPPILPIDVVDMQSVRKLSPVLQLFADSDKRTKLPYRTVDSHFRAGGTHKTFPDKYSEFYNTLKAHGFNSPTDVYAAFSSILLATGGHPRMVATLFSYCCVAQLMKTIYIRRFKQWY